MPTAFFHALYADWKPIQREKYAQLLPLLREHVPREASVLDLGIGYAWLAQYLLENGFAFSRIVGVETQKERAKPLQKGIDYVFSPRFATRERFDFVAAFDSAHLLPHHDLARFAKSGGTILLSAPASQAHRIPAQNGVREIARGTAGEREKSAFLLLEKR